MPARLCSFRFLGRAIFTAAVLVGSTRCTQAVERLSFEQVRNLVEKHLGGNANYVRGDLIARGDVEPIFNDLLEMGIRPADEQEELYDSFLPDNDRLVQTLRTPTGRNFMRKVAKIPGAYDRLERLSWIPAGQELLREFIARKDGVTLFKRLLTPEGMKSIEERLAADPRGRNFALPTGHIHTADQLLDQLQEVLSQHKAR